MQSQSLLVAMQSQCLPLVVSQSQSLPLVVFVLLVVLLGAAVAVGALLVVLEGTRAAAVVITSRMLRLRSRYTLG